MGNLKVASVDVKPCYDTITPCLLFELKMEGIESGDEILIPINGMLYSDDGKLLSPLVTDYVSYVTTGVPIAVPAIIIYQLKKPKWKKRYGSPLPTWEEPK